MAAPLGYPTAQCVTCDCTESDWKNSDDDLLICTKEGCSKRYQWYCRADMTANHRRKDHNPTRTQQYFLNTRNYMLRLRQLKPDGWIKSTAKVVAKRELFVATSSLALLDKAGWKILENIPANASVSQYVDTTIAAFTACKTPFGVMMRNLARNQGFVNGLLFAGQVGWYAVDYWYNGNGTFDEFKTKVVKAAKTRTACWACSIIGGAIGFYFAGPMGAQAGSVIGALVADWAAGKYLYASDNAEYARKKTKIENALRKFDYNDGFEKTVKDTNLFTVDELKRRYHVKALWNHPDVLRKQGGWSEDTIQQKWQEFYCKYLLLLNVCQERDRT